ncbi:hypothetical protein [Runella slithyformis]|uniref:Zona occludens toxin N-terminal domain-containing protein n=1 Tax=Runella slithyformis (strain ATCC 29530 / DSM 19594 / LMG 11500 / NCIMB 11436 / LSU 4) TaxID=761193 RepID=A0A7U3ZI71_RUNSL|nr:hypothetical protein [Runella slithyformis]AEI47660.1 hypothetical protein Runsl_1232 [Runella slithyformis DSM 19594]
MEEYKPKIYMQIGGKDTGKSTFTQKFIMNFYAQQRIGCLVLDTAGQDIYADFHPIPLEDIAGFRPLGWHPFYRCQTDDVERFLYLVERYVRNCLIVLEDVTPHFSGTISRNKQKFILQSRNNGLDVLVNAHSIELTSKLLWLHADMLFLRKTPETLIKIPNKTRVPHVIERAMKQIEAENARKVVYNPYGRRVYPAYRTIDLETGTLY